jgi:DNA (cytosine-5)-methyltransferase 1
MTVGSLFSGIGGIDLGLERAGMTIRWQVEKDAWCRRVLSKHWPDVPKYEDITTLTGHELERVDVLAGGFPCQPASLAGTRKGNEDVERWLWPHFGKLIRVLRPRIVLVENVTGLFTVNGGAAFGEIIGGLAEMRYDCEWTVISARDMGAPHLRNRLWIVATNTDDDRPHGDREDEYERKREEMGRRELARGDGGDRDVADTGCQSTRAESDGSRRKQFDGEEEGIWSGKRNRPSDIGKDVAHPSFGWGSSDNVQAGGDATGCRSSGMAHANGSGCEERRGAEPVEAEQRSVERVGQAVADSNSGGLKRIGQPEQRPLEGARGDQSDGRRINGRVFDAEIGCEWAVEPNVGRVAHGVPRRVDRLRGLGNAVVPQIVEWIGKRILLSIGDIPT